ncbi:DinB family protein [Thalassiella azotivora]
MADFDWSILEQRSLVAMLRGQLGFSWWDLDRRLDGLTDDELRWEPAPGACGVRPRGQSPSPRPAGQGTHQLDYGYDSVEGPPPLRTIGWLVAHLTEVFTERWDWTFGEHRLRVDDLTFHTEAAPAVAGLREAVTRWRDRVDALTEEQALTVGLSRATEIDAAAPFGHLVLHLNRELIHHGAEIMVLRDLYRVRSAAT